MGLNLAAERSRGFNALSTADQLAAGSSWRVGLGSLGESTRVGRRSSLTPQVARACQGARPACLARRPRSQPQNCPQLSAGAKGALCLCRGGWDGAVQAGASPVSRGDAGGLPSCSRGWAPCRRRCSESRCVCVPRSPAPHGERCACEPLSQPARKPSLRPPVLCVTGVRSRRWDFPAFACRQTSPQLEIVPRAQLGIRQESQDGRWGYTDPWKSFAAVNSGACCHRGSL